MELKHNPGGVYFNTTNESQSEVKDKVQMTGNQNAKILAVFFANKSQSFTCWDVRARIGGRKILIGSVRRAIHTLWRKGFIVCTGKKIAATGANNYTYKFKKA
jgi:hypothetical protein